MRPCVFIHTNHKQMLGALVAHHSLQRNSAAADRFDIRRLMLGSDCLRAVLTLAAAGIAAVMPGIALLIGLALTFGTVDAVFLPSAGAMRPRLLRPEQYQSGSVAAETTARLTLCLGAPLGGVVENQSGDVTV